MAAFLSRADPSCQYGHEWRHVDGFAIDAGAAVIRARDDQDVIACLRCNLVSARARASAPSIAQRKLVDVIDDQVANTPDRVAP